MTERHNPTRPVEPTAPAGTEAARVPSGAAVQPDRRSLYERRIGVFVLATLCCLLWGSAYPAIKGGYAMLGIGKTDIASQVLFAGWRFTLAGAGLLIFAAAVGRPVLAQGARHAGQLMMLGLTQTAIQYVFFYIGLAHATGVKSSIMNATGVFFSVALAHFIYADDRMSGRKALGCLIGFLGVIVVNIGGGNDLGLDFTLLGEGFVVIAAFVLAVASIYGKQLSRSLDPMVMTGWQLLIGGVLLTIAGTVFGGHIDYLDFQSGALLTYLVVLSSVAFAIWSLLLKHNPVGLIAAFNFLVPVFGVGLSAAFLGESIWHWKNLAALVLVCGGIWLVTRAPKPA
nr:DMT family transporter [Sphingomonas turrisvirgatae]